LLAALAVSVSLALPVGAAAAEPIRIGEINSQGRASTASQAYATGCRWRWNRSTSPAASMAAPLQLISRDDLGDADQAARNARELVSKEHVEVLTGTMLSDVALAVAREAARSKTVLVVGDALTDAITLDKGNRYTFRVRPRPTCWPRCWPSRRHACRGGAGPWWRPTMNTDRVPWPASRCC
jgi:branched-chain amino acid transport system substrate-binding protein